MDKIIFDQLKEVFGNHSKVARAVGVDPRVYRSWRSTGRLSRTSMRCLELLFEMHKKKPYQGHKELDMKE